MERIRTAVIGAGKMGAIHAKVYSSLPQSELVGVVDIDNQRAQKVAGKYKCRVFADCTEMLNKVDAVTIATPTVCHCELAKIFLENGVAVLIEKPLAANVEEGLEIAEMARKSGVIAAVGHSERCNPVVQAIKRLEIEPRFIEAHRISPYPFRSMDIGVVLDVMIHDIDIVLSLAGSKIKKVDAVGVNVVDKEEDICNARIAFDNSCIANITASRLALKTERKIRVFSKQAYLSVDYLKKTGQVIKAAGNVDVVEWVREHKKIGDFDLLKTKWADLLHIENLDVDDKEPLRLEQEAFLRACVGETDRPEVSVEEGLAAMQCAEVILQSMKGHKWDRQLLDGEKTFN